MKMMEQEFLNILIRDRFRESLLSQNLIYTDQSIKEAKIE